jgi:hypothetical protein
MGESVRFEITHGEDERTVDDSSGSKGRRGRWIG